MADRRDERERNLQDMLDLTVGKRRREKVKLGRTFKEPKEKRTFVQKAPGGIQKLGKLKKKRGRKRKLAAMRFRFQNLKG